MASPDIAITVAGRGSGKTFGQLSHRSPPPTRESAATTSSRSVSFLRIQHAMRVITREAYDDPLWELRRA